jgi:hypothetical protein
VRLLAVWWWHHYRWSGVPTAARTTCWACCNCDVRAASATRAASSCWRCCVRWGGVQRLSRLSRRVGHSTGSAVRLRGLRRAEHLPRSQGQGKEGGGMGGERREGAGVKRRLGCWADCR